MKLINYFKYIASENKAAYNMAAIQGLFWFAWAFGTYHIVYLQEIGFNASLIGSINALSSMTAIFACMLFGMLSDKLNSIKKVLIGVVICVAVLYTLTPFLPVDPAYFVITYVIYCPLLNVFRGSVIPLLDNLSVRTCAAKRINYGAVRSFGSLSFSVAAFIVVAVIANFGLKSSFISYGLLAIPTIILLFFAHDPKVGGDDKKEKRKISLKPLFKNYYYVTFLIFAAIIYVGFSAEFSFITYMMASLNIPSENLGTFLAVRALSEVPLLFFIGKIRSKFKLPHLIIFAATLMTIEFFLLGFWAHDLTSMIICGALFGLGNGMFIGTVPFYLFRLATDELKASAQTLYSSVCAISGILGNLGGGYLFDLVGASPYYIILGTITTTAIIFLVVSLNMKKNLPNPADD